MSGAASRVCSKILILWSQRGTEPSAPVYENGWITVFNVYTSSPCVSNLVILLAFSLDVSLAGFL